MITLYRNFDGLEAVSEIWVIHKNSGYFNTAMPFAKVAINQQKMYVLKLSQFYLE